MFFHFLHEKVKLLRLKDNKQPPLKKKIFKIKEIRFSFNSSNVLLCFQFTYPFLWGHQAIRPTCTCRYVIIRNIFVRKHINIDS